MRKKPLVAFTAVVAALIGSSGCGPSGGSSGGATGSIAAPSREGLPGSWGKALVSAKSYSSLRVEVDYALGHEPTTAALQMLALKLRLHLRKPGGIEVVKGRVLVTPRREVWTLADTKLLEAQNRSSFSLGSRAVVWVAYLPGKSERDGGGASPTLGWSQSGTSFVVFKHNIDANPPLFARPSDLEGAVLVHEMGHLLGITEHCEEEDCIMTPRSTEWDVRGEALTKFVETTLGRL